MGWGRTGCGAVVACAVLSGVLGSAAPVAGAGTDTTSGDGPKQGVTYSGRVKGLRVKLSAIAPNVDGEMTMLAELRLECGDVRGQSAVDEERIITVGPDGSYSVEVNIDEDDAGERRVDIELSGRFEDQDATTADFSYDLFDEDDDGNTDSCEEEGEVELDGGRADKGLQRVEVAIPIETDGESGAGGLSLEATTEAMFLGLGDQGDVTELFRIDPSTNEVAAQNTVPVDLDLVAVGASLYGMDRNLGTLIPVDPTSLTLGTPIPVATPRQDADEEITIAPFSSAAIDGALWLGAIQDRELVRFDPASNAVVARVPLDAYPQQIVASATNLYVETQSTPAFDGGGGQLPESNVIRRIDPASGQTLATSPAYFDDSIVGIEVSDDGVIVTLVPPGDDVEERVVLDPETLEVRDEDVDASRRSDVPADVLSEFATTEAGFDAVWVYNDERRVVYRVSTT